MTAKTSRLFYVGAFLIRTTNTSSCPVARKNVPTKDYPRKISLSDRPYFPLRRVCVAAAISVVNNPNEGSPEDVVDDLLVEERATISHKRSLCSVGIGNLDLGHIVNGYPEDLLEKKQFYKTFSCQKILSWCQKVGFHPMNRNSLKDPKVRVELGSGGAPKEMVDAEPRLF